MLQQRKGGCLYGAFLPTKKGYFSSMGKKVRRCKEKFCGMVCDREAGHEGPHRGGGQLPVKRFAFRGEIVEDLTARELRLLLAVAEYTDKRCTSPVPGLPENWKDLNPSARMSWLLFGDYRWRELDSLGRPPNANNL